MNEYNCAVCNTPMASADPSSSCESCSKKGDERGAGRSAAESPKTIDWAMQSGGTSNTKKTPEAGRSKTKGPLLAMLLVGVAFGLMIGYELQFGEAAFTAKFLHRGWTPIAASLLTAWALALVWGKSRQVRSRRSTLVASFGLAGVDFNSDEGIRESIATVQNTALSLPDNLIANRIQDGIERYRISRSIRDVAEILRESSDESFAALDSSHGLIRAFQWTIPILGFIGTVMGVGEAIGGFGGVVSSGPAQIDLITASLTGITDQLGVAFDTTLVALVLSVLVVVATSIVEQSEKSTLLDCDGVCRSTLLSVLPTESSEQGTSNERVLDALDALGRELPRAIEHGVDAALSSRDEYMTEVFTWLRTSFPDAIEKSVYAGVSAQIPDAAFWKSEVANLGRGFAESLAEPWRVAQDEWSGHFVGFAEQVEKLHADNQNTLNSAQDSARETSRVTTDAVDQLRVLVSEQGNALARLTDGFSSLVAAQERLTFELCRASGEEGLPAVVSEFRDSLNALAPALNRIADEPLDVKVEFSAFAPSLNGGNHNGQ